MDFNEFNERVAALRASIDEAKRQIESLQQEYGESHLKYPVGTKLRIEYPDGTMEEVYVAGFTIRCDGNLNVEYNGVKKDGSMSSRPAYPQMWKNPTVTKTN